MKLSLSTKPTVAINQQIVKNLQSFYEKPIAQVSMQLIATITLVVFFAIFAIRPTILTMTQLTKDIEEKKAANQILAQKIAALSTLSGVYATIQPDMPNLQMALPESSDFDGALRRVEKLASERQIIISQFHIDQVPKDISQAPASSADNNAFMFSFLAKGTYIQLKQFFNDIEHADRFMRLNNVSFSSSQTNEGEIILSGSLYVYYYGAPQPIVTDAEKLRK